MIFGIVLPVLLVVVSAAVDYSNMNSQHARLRSVADSAALAAAREMRLGATDAAALQKIAEAYVYALVPPERLLGAPVVTATIGADRSTVSVGISQTLGSMMGVRILPVPDRVSVSSVARIMSGAPICLVGLDASASATSLNAGDSARLSAPGCAVYSNARGSVGMAADADAYVDVALACSGGGVRGASRFSTIPRLDCPQFPDPLSARPDYSAVGCTATNLTLSGPGLTRLNPGIYCGGLKISDDASVELNPGVFVIKGGPLTVKDKASLKGVNAGFYLADREAVINFTDSSTIDISGPTDGWMAGMLIQERRVSGLDELKIHRITTPKAQRLLGTIYLPRGLLKVETASSVGASSAFTIIVAARISMGERANLVLNTGYGSTDVPVPTGVGPAGGSILLDN